MFPYITSRGALCHACVNGWAIETRNVPMASYSGCGATVVGLPIFPILEFT